MRFRHIIYIAILSVIQFTFWYYVMAFCSVYINSNKEWLIGALIGNAIDTFALKPSYSIVKGILRFLAMNCEYKISQKIYSAVLCLAEYL